MAISKYKLYLHVANGKRQLASGIWDLACKSSYSSLKPANHKWQIENYMSLQEFRSRIVTRCPIRSQSVSHSVNTSTKDGVHVVIYRQAKVRKNGQCIN